MNSTSATTYAAGTVLGRITANGKLAPYASGAADGTEVPKAVLTQAVEFGAAGDLPVRALVSGRVRAGDMIEHGVGVITDVAVLDQLRDYGIVALATQELTELDNQ